MIIPINNGRSITPIYIPQPVVTSTTGELQQSNTTTQNNDPTLEAWIVLGVFLISIIAVVICFIKLLKYFLEVKNE